MNHHFCFLKGLGLGTVSESKGNGEATHAHTLIYTFTPAYTQPRAPTHTYTYIQSSHKGPYIHTTYSYIHSQTHHEKSNALVPVLHTPITGAADEDPRETLGNFRNGCGIQRNIVPPPLLETIQTLFSKVIKKHRERFCSRDLRNFSHTKTQSLETETFFFCPCRLKIWSTLKKRNLTTLQIFDIVMQKTN